MALDGSGIVGRSEAGADPEGALRLVGLLPLMKLTTGAPAVTVALIDGPVALDHPDLATENIRLLPATTGVTCTHRDGVACTHGTYVAGILHANRDGSVRGLCPGCTLLVRPIFSEASAVPETDGMPSAAVPELAAALHDVIEAGASIVNLSVGLAPVSSHAEPALDRVFEHATRRGVIIVAAAGNQGTLGSSSITRHAWVIPVVACDGRGHALAQSNLGASIGRNGVMAPGYEIRSVAASGGHASFSGSSAAVPFVTGTVALLWSLFPQASAGQGRLAIAGGLGRRRSVTPPMLNAWAAYRAFGPVGMGMAHHDR